MTSFSQLGQYFGGVIISAFSILPSFTTEIILGITSHALLIKTVSPTCTHRFSTSS
jgi:hypothetical protein